MRRSAMALPSRQRGNQPRHLDQQSTHGVGPLIPAALRRSSVVRVIVRHSSRCPRDPMHYLLDAPSLPLVRDPADLEVVLVPDSRRWSARLEALPSQFSPHVVPVIPHRELEGQVHPRIIAAGDGSSTIIVQQRLSDQRPMTTCME